MMQVCVIWGVTIMQSLPSALTALPPSPQGYIYGAFFSTKLGYRVEGDDKVLPAHFVLATSNTMAVKHPEGRRRRSQLYM